LSFENIGPSSSIIYEDFIHIDSYIHRQRERERKQMTISYE